MSRLRERLQAAYESGATCQEWSQWLVNQGRVDEDRTGHRYEVEGYLVLAVKGLCQVAIADLCGFSDQDWDAWDWRGWWEWRAWSRESLVDLLYERYLEPTIAAIQDDWRWRRPHLVEELADILQPVA